MEAAEGSFDGDIVGFTLEGSNEGTILGFKDAIAVGCSVGSKVSNAEGNKVGPEEGIEVGYVKQEKVEYKELSLNATINISCC